MIRIIDYLKERPQAARYLLYVIIGAVVVWSLTVDTSHAHTWAEKYIPGFWSFFGLIASVVLIFFARWLAGAGIGREDDYYDK